MVVEGASSHSKPVVSPRLCPRAITFLIYINDVMNIELSPGTLLSLYTDDMLLYKQINSLNDYIDLQADINGQRSVVGLMLTIWNSTCKTMISTLKSVNQIHSLHFSSKM